MAEKQTWEARVLGLVGSAYRDGLTRAGWSASTHAKSAALLSDIKALEQRAEEAEGWRMCVACGRRQHPDVPKDDRPECSPACTWDATPDEAWQHWRQKWHDQQAEVKRLREALKAIYGKAGNEIWASRRRKDTAGHVCDYRNALHSVKDRAKQALAQQEEGEGA